MRVCVFITAGPITKLFAGGGGGEWTTCAMIDDEPRPVWMSPLITFFFLESLSEPADRDADAPHTVLIVDVGHMAWYETHKNTHTHPHTHIHIHIHSSEH